MSNIQIVTQEKWVEARIALLKEEKSLDQARDLLPGKRKALPAVALEKNYVFGGPSGPVTLKDLFEGRSQLALTGTVGSNPTLSATKISG